MALLQVLAIRRGTQPQLAFSGQGQPHPRRLERSLRRFVRQHGQPHHFKLRVVLSGEETAQAKPAPTAVANGLRMFTSRPLSREHERDSTIAFPLQPGLARQLIVTPRGRVDSHPLLVA